MEGVGACYVSISAIPEKADENHKNSQDTLTQVKLEPGTFTESAMVYQDALSAFIRKYLFVYSFNDALFSKTI
jgi:hypothetical protein